MTDPAPTGITTAIVVTVNAARRCGGTLELAAALATSVGADLEVVLVEDANLLRIADLPVSREVDRTSGMLRELDGRRMLRALHCEARHLRREVSRIGNATAVRSTMRVVRGHYLTEALAASANVDVAFLHGARRPLPGEHLPSTRLRPIAAGAMHGEPRRVGGSLPVWTLFDGSPASRRALEVAVKLARTLACSLVVLLPAGGAEDIERREHAAQITADRVDLHYLVVAENRLSEVSPALAPGAGSLLVLARDCADLEDGAARNSLASLALPVVLVA